MRAMASGERPLLALFCRSRISSQWSLSGVKQTCGGWPRIDANDPGRVKTVTRKKCRKYSSPPRASSSRVQHDSAVMTENCPVIFYARDGCESFYTAKTQRGHWLARNAAASCSVERNPKH